jgi:hypothetical protein
VLVDEASKQTVALLMEETAMSGTSQAHSAHTVVSHCDSVLLHQVVLRANPDVQATNMDGETVLLDLSTGRYYTLNQLGSLIWELCTGAQTISDIHTVLCDRFDVAPERALDDLVTLVNQLTQEGLLQQERR